MSETSFDLPPLPEALVESMRAVGYSLPDAIADLVDNSLSAGARHIDITFDWAGVKSSILVLDDGGGMNPELLRNAMRLGSSSPSEVRAATDLGRFGLGLKSACWSQGRRMTVISSDGSGSATNLCWDLNEVVESQTWTVRQNAALSVQTISARIDAKSTGTGVLIEALDRAVPGHELDDKKSRVHFFRAVEAVHHHLEMVFHRFLTGKGAVSMTINGADLVPWDPFLKSNLATQILPSESLRHRDRDVNVQPYVLPHKSKLDDKGHANLAGQEGWNAQQGFYVYRARRLIVAGGWLGLPRMQREEHYKLARIQVDIDNQLDDEWQIDIRKSAARVPDALRDDFTRIGRAVRKHAGEVYRFRGKTTARTGGAGAGLDFVWRRVTGRDGHTWYRVDRKHPVIAALSSTSPEAKHSINKVLRLAEENLPVESINVDLMESSEMEGHLPYAGDTAAVEDLLRSALERMIDAGTDRHTALDALSQVEPFNSYPGVVLAVREETE